MIPSISNLILGAWLLTAAIAALTAFTAASGGVGGVAPLLATGALMAVRWLMVAWVFAQTGPRWAIPAHAVLGLISAASLAAGIDGGPPTVTALRFVPTILAASVIAYLSRRTGEAQGLSEAAAGGLLAVGLVVALAGLRETVPDFLRTRAARAEWEARDRNLRLEEESRRQAGLLASVRAIPQDAPLAEWLTFADWMQPEPVRAAAMAAVSTRPEVAREWTALLRDARGKGRLHALSALEKAPFPPPADMAEAAKGAVRAVIESGDAGLAESAWPCKIALQWLARHGVRTSEEERLLAGAERGGR